MSLGVDKFIGILLDGSYLGGFSDFQNLLAQWYLVKLSHLREYLINS